MRRRGTSTGRRLLGLVLMAVLAACDPPGTTTNATPSPTAAATVTSSPSITLHAPVAAGQRLLVFNGYDNPKPPDPCPAAGTAPHDHCASQADALDLVPSDLADPRILAPAGGKVWWRDPDTEAAGCLGINTWGSDNLTVCHFATGKILVRQGDVVVAGQVLGLRDPKAWWIHLSLYDNGKAGKPPIAFEDDYALEGVALSASDPPEFDRWCGTTITSTTQLPAGDANATQARYTTFDSAPALACGSKPATPTPTPPPTATPTASLTPTPRPAAPPQPTGTTWTRVGETLTGEPGNGTETIHFLATWKEPKGAATKFIIYGLVPCLRYARQNDEGPCIVKGMAIDMADLELLASVPGDKRSARVDVERGRGAGSDPYDSYLIRAVNDAGKSKFTILEPGEVCWQCAPGNHIP